MFPYLITGLGFPHHIPTLLIFMMCNLYRTRAVKLMKHKKVDHGCDSHQSCIEVFDRAIRMKATIAEVFSCVLVLVH